MSCSLGSCHYLRQGGRWNSENCSHSKFAPPPSRHPGSYFGGTCNKGVFQHTCYFPAQYALLMDEISKELNKVTKGVQLPNSNHYISWCFLTVHSEKKGVPKRCPGVLLLETVPYYGQSNSAPRRTVSVPFFLSVF